MKLLNPGIFHLVATVRLLAFFPAVVAAEKLGLGHGQVGLLVGEESSLAAPLLRVDAKRKEDLEEKVCHSVSCCLFS
jgi:hypothetical protein